MKQGISEDFIRKFYKLSGLLQEDFNTKRAAFIREGNSEELVDKYLNVFRLIKNAPPAAIADSNEKIRRVMGASPDQYAVLRGTENIDPVNNPQDKQTLLRARISIDNYPTFNLLRLIVDYVRSQTLISGDKDDQEVDVEFHNGVTIYEDDDLEIFHGSSAGACLRFNRKMQGITQLWYSWCIAQEPTHTAYGSYRFMPGREYTIYFVRNKNKPSTDRWHVFVVQVYKDADLNRQDKIQYQVTSSRNDGENHWNWGQVLRQEPLLQNHQQLFKPIPLMPTEKEEWESYKSGTANYCRLPYNKKLNYIAVNKKLTDSQWDCSPEGIKNHFIGEGIPLTTSIYNTIKDQRQLIGRYVTIVIRKILNERNVQEWRNYQLTETEINVLPPETNYRFEIREGEYETRRITIEEIIPKLSGRDNLKMLFLFSNDQVYDRVHKDLLNMFNVTELNNIHYQIKNNTSLVLRNDADLVIKKNGDLLEALINKGAKLSHEQYLMIQPYGDRLVNLHVEKIVERMAANAGDQQEPLDNTEIEALLDQDEEYFEDKVNPVISPLNAYNLVVRANRLNQQPADVFHKLGKEAFVGLGYRQDNSLENLITLVAGNIQLNPETDNAPVTDDQGYEVGPSDYAAQSKPKRQENNTEIQNEINDLIKLHVLNNDKLLHIGKITEYISKVPELSRKYTNTVYKTFMKARGNITLKAEEMMFLLTIKDDVFKRQITPLLNNENLKTLLYFAPDLKDVAEKVGEEKFETLGTSELNDLITRRSGAKHKESLELLFKYRLKKPFSLSREHFVKLLELKNEDLMKEYQVMTIRRILRDPEEDITFEDAKALKMIPKEAFNNFIQRISPRQARVLGYKLMTNAESVNKDLLDVLPINEAEYLIMKQYEQGLNSVLYETVPFFIKKFIDEDPVRSLAFLFTINDSSALPDNFYKEIFAKVDNDVIQEFIYNEEYRPDPEDDEEKYHGYRNGVEGIIDTILWNYPKLDAETLGMIYNFMISSDDSPSNRPQDIISTLLSIGYNENDFANIDEIVDYLIDLAHKTHQYDYLIERAREMANNNRQTWPNQSYLGRKILQRTGETEQ